MLVREKALALEAVLTRLQGDPAAEDLLTAQEGHLRRAEVLLSRLRYWNDREGALREQPT